MIAKIRSDSLMPGAWVNVQSASAPTAPSVGQTATLDASGLAIAASSPNEVDVETFVSRVVQSLQGRVVQQRRLQQFAGTIVNNAKMVNCDAYRVKPIYDEMIVDIRREASTHGSWIATGMAPQGASPQQGQMATLDAAGLAGTAASANQTEVE